MLHKFAGLGKGKVDIEFGSEGKRVAKFSQLFPNGLVKLACSCEIALQNFIVRNWTIRRNWPVLGN